YRLQLGSNPVNGVSIMGDTGNITVTDGPVHKTVRFYKVNITEEGLPGNSTDWGFPYSYSGTYSNGTQFSRSGFYPNSTGPITLYLPNATYSIHPVSNGYYSTPLDFRLNGKLLNLTETFHKVYHVTFVEHNLTGSNAEYWKVGGFPTAYGMSSPYIVGASAETFSVPNGTFSFNVTGLSDYETTINGSIYTVKSTLENQNSTFTVNGSNTVVNLYFNVTETPANNYRNGPGLSSLYGIIAIMSIITGSSVAASVAYFRLRRR
ncbi:MAG TPA: hypothetical protein VJ944_03390, partial [Thermoplasmataceae archaeon]|nr:hypothetical protein [Thermoplasmataceae archaeon]